MPRFLILFIILSSTPSFANPNAFERSGERTSVEVIKTQQEANRSLKLRTEDLVYFEAEGRIYFNEVEITKSAKELELDGSVAFPFDIYDLGAEDSRYRKALKQLDTINDSANVRRLCTIFPLALRKDFELASLLDVVLKTAIFVDFQNYCSPISPTFAQT